MSGNGAVAREPPGAGDVDDCHARPPVRVANGLDEPPVGILRPQTIVRFNNYRSVTLVGIFTIPVLYVVFQWVPEKAMGQQKLPRSIRMMRHPPRLDQAGALAGEWGGPGPRRLFLCHLGQIGRQETMWTRRGLLMALGAATLAGCAGSGPGGGTYTQYVWDDPFYDDDWIYYYDEYDEDFLAGLDDAQKAALKERWDQLSPEEKQEIREQWDGLSDADRAQVRTAWDGLDADQRAQVISSMQNRIRTGTLRPVVPTPAQPSTPSRITPSFARDRIGRSGRGGFGGRGGGRMGRR